jgi:NHLM bacteriocin system ABC transporter ATP-binding protein
MSIPPPVLTDSASAARLLLDRLAATPGVGEPRTLGGDAPFLIHDDAAWIIQSGHVDLFAVLVAGGRPRGQRAHSVRVPAGYAVFGVATPPADDAYALLAVAASNTILVRVPGPRLRALCLDAGWAADTGAAIEQWASVLGDAIRGTVSPERCDELSAGESRTLAAGDSVRAAPGVCWITPRGPAASTCISGRVELALDGAGPTPLAPRLAITARQPVTLVSEPLESIGEIDSAWEGVDRLYRLVVDAAALTAAEIADAARDRQHRRAAASRGTLARACAELLAPFGKTDDAAADPALVSTGDADPLLIACQLVGKAMGLAVKSYPKGHGLVKPRDPLAAIARASRIRTRQIAFRDQWWRTESGPILGELADSGRPVALLSVKRQYVLVDPITRQRTTVTDAVAATLKPFGQVFYRPFPDHALSAGDVLKFGAAGCKSDIVTGITMGTIAALLGLIPSAATGWIFNTIIPGAERSQLLQVTIVLIVCAVATAMFTLARGIALLRIEGRMGAAVQAAVWDRLLSLPMPFFRPYTSGNLAIRAMGIDQIRQVISGTTVTAIMGGIFSLSNFALMFWYSPAMTWRATLVLLVAFLTTAVGIMLQLKPQRGVFEITARSSGTVLQLLTSVAKLRVASAEVHAFARWAGEFGKQRTLRYGVRAIGNFVAAFNAAFPLGAYIVIFWIALPLIGPHGDVQTGDFLAFLSAFGNCMGSLLPTAAAILSALQIIPLYEQAQPILRTRPEVDLGKLDPGALTGDIDVQHLVFRYRPDGPPVLRDVSLHIAAGEFVAFVGPSGSGKSTILRLLLGFETAESGLIYYDGQELGGLDVQAVRRQVGVVLQSGRLLSGDIYTNIVGSTSASRDDAWEAARLAGLAPDVEAMPMGMHTVISEGGGTLSGGQRQRLLIARAIVHRPRLLFFDEATSALDNRTQDIVGHSLAGLRATRVVVAHRLSTILKADRIYVIQAGRVAQIGTYETLLQEPGPFADLARRQLT